MHHRGIAKSTFELGHYYLDKKKFIQRNNGKIFVKSETGRGSIFTFTLPLANS